MISNDFEGTVNLIGYFHGAMEITLVGLRLVALQGCFWNDQSEADCCYCHGDNKSPDWLH